MPGQAAEEAAAPLRFGDGDRLRCGCAHASAGDKPPGMYVRLSSFDTAVPPKFITMAAPRLSTAPTPLTDEALRAALPPIIVGGPPLRLAGSHAGGGTWKSSPSLSKVCVKLWILPWRLMVTLVMSPTQNSMTWAPLSWESKDTPPHGEWGVVGTRRHKQPKPPNVKIQRVIIICNEAISSRL